MKMLIPVGNGIFAHQEAVKVHLILEHNGLRMALHRPHKEHRNVNTLWIVSDLESGLHLCSGLNRRYVIKKAEKLVDKYLDKIIEKKKKHFESTLFI
ncbi:hypothetical protein [Cytobacillus praedii]|uniref:hypothetical protein n=1 Tax=Cytobacillus praedii TaxID=1742358 RepID=UPI00070CCA51|nr:hypothetical protein [Cytobacillus praedii]